MQEVNLIELAEKYYGSKHYLFLILSHNGISLPASFSGGEVIELPPRGPGARLTLAERCMNWGNYQPV